MPSKQERWKLELTPVTGVEPEIGRWLDALGRVRRITLRAVEGIDQRTLDWEGPVVTTRSVRFSITSPASSWGGCSSTSAAGRASPRRWPRCSRTRRTMPTAG
jgi:hypothetical protein